METRERVAEEVRALLARRRLSGRQVAVSLGWSPNYISRRLRAETAFDVDDLEALAEFLNVQVTTFFKGLTQHQGANGGSLTAGEVKASYQTVLDLDLPNLVTVRSLAA